MNKVWHKDLIYKLKQNVTASNLLNTLANFLDDRKRRVVLNRQHSVWETVKEGVPQGSFFGPLLFFIYINVLSDNLVSNSKLFADGT